ncbi:hypothetical protein GCM10009689_17500 [Brevibacterium antiquum]
MAIPRDQFKLAIALAAATAMMAGITTIITLARSRRTVGDHEYHPWDHTVSPSDSAA